MACPVCFNAAASDDTVRASLNLGIFVLLGVTACVLSGFLAFIISIARRASSNVELPAFGHGAPADLPAFTKAPASRADAPKAAGAPAPVM